MIAAKLEAIASEIFTEGFNRGRGHAEDDRECQQAWRESIERKRLLKLLGVTDVEQKGV